MDDDKKIIVREKIELIEKDIHNLKHDMSILKDNVILIKDLLCEYIIVNETEDKIKNVSQKKGWFY